MKTVWGGAALVLMTLTGCVEFPLFPDGSKAPASAAERPAAPVTADQVTAANAREMAQALRHELDREVQPANAKALP